MKSFYSIIAVTVIMFSYGCKKQLYKDPIGLLTPDQINLDPKLGTVTSSVTASYQMLASTLNLLGEWQWDGGTVTRNDFILQDIAAGDMQKKWNPDGDQAWMDQYSTFSFTASNAGFNGQWSYDFEGISRTNLAISYLTDPAVTTKIGIDETLRKRLLGEVYFLRAYYYFELVNNFGDVPLLLKPLKDFDEAYKVAKREKKAVVLEQVSKDLADAKPLMPNSKFSDNVEKWRVSKGAVMAMQAKVALYSKKWAEVITIITELEGLSFYSLNANYFDNFSVAKEFADNEVIFTYDHLSGKNPRNGNGLCALQGWGFIAPTANFVSAFEPNDPRLLFTADVANQACYKLLGTTDNSNKGNDDAPNNKVFIRWADVMLWKAEAYNESANYPAAIGIINAIRARARTSATVTGGVPPAGTLPDRNIASTDKNLVTSWLVSERRVELGFESQRFYDLKRWETAKAVLTAMGRNFQDKNYLYPIPQGEIDKSGGSISQNTGF